MTELQLSGAQAMLDILAAVSPVVLAFVVSLIFVKIMVKFITGRGI